MKLLQKIHYFSLCLLYVGGLTVLDGVSKSWIIQNPSTLTITPYFNLIYTKNTGIGFGLLNQALNKWAIAGLSMIILVYLFYLFIQSTSKVEQLALLTVISGALGNIYDRLVYGAVIDFLDVHLFGYHWPAFNIADVCICLGVGTLIVKAILGKNF